MLSRYLWPLFFSILLTFLQVGVLILAGTYKQVMFPSDVAFSILAYDVWAFSEYLGNRNQPINRGDPRWFFAFPFIHIVTYIFALS